MRQAREVPVGRAGHGHLVRLAVGAQIDRHALERGVAEIGDLDAVLAAAGRDRHGVEQRERDARIAAADPDAQLVAADVEADRVAAVGARDGERGAGHLAR